MTAQYNGFCKTCRQEIKRGEEIRKSAQGGYEHVTCPPRKDSYGQEWKAERDGTCTKCGTAYLNNKVRYHYLATGSRQIEHVDCERAATWNAKQAEEKAAAKAEREAAAPYRLGGGSGYGCQGWKAGEIVHATRTADGRVTGHPTDGETLYLYVVESGSQYYREGDDAMSFGVGDESGYTYWARCRAATESESADLRAAEQRRAERAAAVEELQRMEQTATQNAEHPDGDHVLTGEMICEQGREHQLYGGGSWWAITDDSIWYVQNNGADGDNWSGNNVRTGGAGARGWRYPRTAEMEAQLRRIAAVLA
jgi:hypothetical protein